MHVHVRITGGTVEPSESLLRNPTKHALSKTISELGMSKEVHFATARHAHVQSSCARAVVGRPVLTSARPFAGVLRAALVRCHARGPHQPVARVRLLRGQAHQAPWHHCEWQARRHGARRVLEPREGAELKGRRRLGRTSCKVEEVMRIAIPLGAKRSSRCEVMCMMCERREM